MNEKIVFTNGIFDLIHGGHIRLLRYAKSLGTTLVVGINSDESTKRLKGPLRPILSQDTRFAIISELKCVDEAIVFYEDTPEKLIEQIQPDILIKGPEASDCFIPGSDFVLSCGGKVIIPDWHILESTSSIIRKIRNGNPITS